MNTIEELREWIRKECFNEENISINSDWKNLYSGFGLEKSSEGYKAFYFERGERDILYSSASEKEIVDFFQKELKDEKSLKWHFLKMFKSEKIKNKCLEELEDLGLRIEIDEILYNSPKDIRYRIFVVGCGAEKAKNIVEKYQEENTYS
jgi:hypothetical protein